MPQSHHGRNAARLLLVLATVGAWMVIAAAPAVAQRDPFDPLVSTGSTTTADTGTTTTSSDTQADTTTQTTTESTVEENSLPNTGSRMTPWLALAYVLVTVGAGLLVLSKTLQPDRGLRE
jgi:LPXTG-motif cell wall-anchored protein